MLRQSFRQLTTKPLSRAVGIRYASALSNATVTNLEKRWEDLPETDQKDIISQLSERQKLPWKDLTLSEKKAAWYISFGEWGPRRPVHTKEDKLYIFWGTVIGIVISATIFGAFRYNRNVPKTMNREWQAASDEYLKSKNAEPFTGYSQIQSK
ncbi:BA75_03938T0 [Komagataella pastoris]|uniref:BA75_03938T0 n=3 Tax=Komagataella pastoris TaxID=4922 RepID=A0A1B2JG46_PICPA|nr:BA75_03938T0 [Komagataella pastoris]